MLSFPPILNLIQRIFTVLFISITAAPSATQPFEHAKQQSAVRKRSKQFLDQLWFSLRNIMETMVKQETVAALWLRKISNQFALHDCWSFQVRLA